MLTDVQTPFLGTPVVPLRLQTDPPTCRSSAPRLQQVALVYLFQRRNENRQLCVASSLVFPRFVISTPKETSATVCKISCLS